MPRSRSGKASHGNGADGVPPRDGVATAARTATRVRLEPESLPLELLSAAHEVAGMGVFVVNLRTRHVRASRELSTLFRVSNEPLEMSLDDYRQRFYHPDDRERIAARTDRAIAMGESRLGEMRIRRADGSEMWARISSVQQTTDGGDPILVGVVQDVTESHVAQQELLRSELRLKTVIEKAPVAIIVIRGGRTAYANEKARAMFGVMNREQAVGLRVEDFWAPESREHVSRLVIARAAGDRMPDAFDGMAQRADGSRFPVHADLEMVELPDGPSTLAFLTDTSERRRSEARIEYLNRLHAMVSAVNEMIVRVDDVGVVLQRACDIAVEKGGFRMAWIGEFDEGSGEVRPVASAGVVDGYLDGVHIDMRDPGRSAGPSGRAMRTGVHQFCNDIATDPRMAPWREAALARGYRSSGAFPLRASGHVMGLLTLYSTKVGSFDPGELELLDGLAEDIGFAIELSRRQAEHRSLEEQLRQAQKMEAIGRLAGGVAHDFNNLLAVILMQTELGVTDDTPKETRDLLREIRGAAERAAGLTRQLLAFSRRQIMQPKEIDLNAAVRELAKMLARVVGEDVALEIDAHPEPLWVRADAGMLDQVLMNLAVNARDAMPSGGTLRLCTCTHVVDEQSDPELRALRHGRYACICVSDTGTGIAPEVLPHIFEPFFTTKESGKGTGLGLATVFGVVKQHDGVVTVRSTVGAGTTFRVLLPELDDLPAKAPRSSAEQAQVRGHELVLLVEDDVAVRRLARRLLERAGYRVLEATTGVEGLMVWDDHRQEVDLLITDLVMPGGMSGQELALRLQARNPALRVIFSTGYSADMAGQELSLHGHQALLQKPFDSKAFLETVRRSLDS